MLTFGLDMTAVTPSLPMSSEILASQLIPAASFIVQTLVHLDFIEELNQLNCLVFRDYSLDNSISIANFRSASYVPLRVLCTI